MNKIFYTENRPEISTDAAAKKIFTEFYRIPDPEILKSETGKPFLKGSDLFFSVTHTKTLFFLAVCDCNVGIDAENLGREIDYLPILPKFSFAEREEIKNKTDFLKHWTAKESAVKWLGGTLAADLKKISFLNGVLYYKELQMPASVFQTEQFGHIVTLCTDRTSRQESKSEFIRFTL